MTEISTRRRETIAICPANILASLRVKPMFSYMYFVNIIYSTIKTPIEEIRTAPAETSLAFLAIMWCLSSIRLTASSMAVLSISAKRRMIIDNENRTNSTTGSFRNRLKRRAAAAMA